VSVQSLATPATRVAVTFGFDAGGTHAVGTVVAGTDDEDAAGADVAGLEAFDDDEHAARTTTSVIEPIRPRLCTCVPPGSSD